MNSFIFTEYSVFFSVNTVVSLVTAYLGWKRRTVISANELSMVMLAASFWSLCLVFEASYTTLSGKLMWAKIAYAGAVSTPVLYLVFVLRFTGFSRLINPGNLLLLFTIPAITFTLALTNDTHQLIWSGFSPVYPETNLMEYIHGLWFWIGYFGYNYLVLIVATFLILRFIIRQPRPFRTQGIAIVTGGLCPWLASMIYLTGLNPVPGLDLVPASIILSGVVLMLVILYRKFLDLVPVARETLVETMNDGIIALDSHNRVQDINPSARNFLGIQAKHITGLTIDHVGAAVLPLLDAVMRHTPVDRIELHENGENRHLSIVQQPLRNQPGSRIVIIRDITEQVNRIMEIREGEHRYKHLLSLFRLMTDNMPDMLWAKDLDKRFIFTNKSICDNLLRATSTDEPIGRTDLFFALRQRALHPENPAWHTFGELCQDSDEVIINSGKPHQFDEFGNVGGKFLYLDVRKAPIMNDDGIMIGVVGSARDITEQKKNETELRKRDLLLDAISRATAVLIKEVDFDKSIARALDIIGKATMVNRVYLFTNHDDPAYAMPLMSQQYEWTDGSVADQIGNEELQNLPYEIACPRWYSILSCGQVVSGLVRDFPEPEKTALSEQSIVSILAAPIFIENHFWGFIGFDDCKTERTWNETEEHILSTAANTIGFAFLRKRNEDALMAAKLKAEESDRLKSAFLMNMSHEIRTPMNGILGFISLLHEPDLTSDERDQYIDIVKKSGDRLLYTIHDIIDMARIESGQSPVVPTGTDIRGVITGLHSAFVREAGQKGLALNMRTDDHLPSDPLMTDRDKLNSILTNLLRNAIKYTHHGSIEFGYEFRGDYIRFFVTDTGIGIAPDKHRMIFERFVQADISHTRHFEGSGLGLSIAKAYTEMLGGTIGVGSEPGKGSTFWFTLPYLISHTVAGTHRDTALAGPEKITPPLNILVAEDDAINFDFLRVILSKYGHRVIHASNGLEAVNYCKSDQTIDLVFMDIKMPVMDGVEAIRHIRAFNTVLPVFVLTAYAAELDQELMPANGINGYLAKPVRKEEVLSCISSHLKQDSP